MPSNQEQQIAAFKRQQLSDPSNPYLPKSDRVLEWTIFNIMESLQTIEKHLAELVVRSRLK